MDNVQCTPDIPGKQVRSLKYDLEKKNAENSAFHRTIDDLTNTLNGLNIVKQNMDNSISNTVESTYMKGKKVKDDPISFKTEYKLFIMYITKKEGADIYEAKNMNSNKNDEHDISITTANPNKKRDPNAPKHQ